MIQLLTNIYVKAQTHPWVVPLRISYFDFFGPIKTLKNHRKHWNKYFHKIFLMNTFIKFHRFEISITSKKKKNLMFLIIAFRKSFKNLT